eukprot:4484145-Prorocentrum_lima.AAC.1
MFDRGWRGKVAGLTSCRKKTNNGMRARNGLGWTWGSPLLPQWSGFAVDPTHLPMATFFFSPTTVDW